VVTPQGSLLVSNGGSIHSVIGLPKVATGRTVVTQLVFVGVPGSEVTRDGYIQLLLLCQCAIELETAKNVAVGNISC
jgi:hypothetical protein